MAVDLWSNAENSSLGMSPRISFSYDLCQTDLGTIERHRSDTMLLESNDFDFCTSKSFEQDDIIPSSSADELFSEGKILPIEIKKQVSLPPKPPSHRNSFDHLKKESLKEIIEKGHKTEEKSSSVSGSKSFWRFKRSSSCGSGYTRSLICSLPHLLRSNSTGSTPNPPKKDNHSSSSKQSSSSAPVKVSGSSKSPLSSSSSNGYPYSTQHNSSMKKNYGSYNNGIRVSPILNVPPPYISKGTVNLFGLGSLFGGKDKSKKKRSEFVY
ncbi:hypothetical protein ACHQM5_009157 [Ranunculus cassubicifolius]